MEINEKNFPSNMHPEPELEEPKAEVVPVAKGRIVKRKKSPGRKIRELFIGDDFEDVKSYILVDIIVPAIKETIVDAVCNTVEMLLGVDTRGLKGRVKGRSSKNGDYVNYANISYKRDDDRSRRRSRGSSRGHNVVDIAFETRAEAEDVLYNLADQCQDFGFVRLADYYELANATQHGDFQSEKWGWEYLGSARVVRDRRENCYFIDFPAPIYLD